MAGSERARLSGRRASRSTNPVPRTPSRELSPANSVPVPHIGASIRCERGAAGSVGVGPAADRGSSIESSLNNPTVNGKCMISAACTKP